MIIREAIGVGSTVEAAMQDAINKLNAGLDENVQTETLALPKKKVLGLFGGSDAQVRAYIEGPDGVKKPSRDSRQSRGNRQNGDKRSSAKREPAKTQTSEIVKESVEAKPVVGVPAAEVDPTSPAGKAYAYLVSVLEKLGCTETDAVISEVEGGSKITLNGSDKLGVIIGRRGETLDALQYLASLVANEKGGGYYRLVIDIGNYREKRENTLEALAKRTAGQVLRTGRSRSLEPMNPYERRIIHTAIQGIEGVTSSSVGDGVGRRVVISPEGKSFRYQNNRSGRGNGGRRPRRTSEKPAVTENTEAQKPKETDGTKLYGKLG